MFHLQCPLVLRVYLWAYLSWFVINTALKQMFKYANMIRQKMGFFAYIIIHAGLFCISLTPLLVLNLIKSSLISIIILIYKSRTSSFTKNRIKHEKKVLLRQFFFFFFFQLSSSGLLHRRIFIRRTIIQREQPRDVRTHAHRHTHSDCGWLWHVRYLQPTDVHVALLGQSQNRSSHPPASGLRPHVCKHWCRPCCHGLRLHASCSRVWKWKRSAFKTDFFSIIMEVTLKF